jgi:hypothetical protein
VEALVGERRVIRQHRRRYGGLLRAPLADLHVETVDFRLVPTAGVHRGHFCPCEELDVEAALVLLASLGNLIGRERRGAGSEPAGHKIDDSGDFSVGIAIAKSGHEFFA